MAEHKVYVAGIPGFVDERRLIEFFEPYGNVVRIEWPRNKNFAFIVFDNERSAQNVLNMGPALDLDGNLIHVKTALPRNGTSGGGFSGQPEPSKSTPNVKIIETDHATTYRIGIGNLPTWAKDEEIIDFFSRCGTIEGFQRSSALDTATLKIVDGITRAELMTSRLVFQGICLQVSDVASNKVFIGAIPPDLTDDMIREYLNSHYGTVIAIEHPTGQNFLFAVFETEENAKACLGQAPRSMWISGYSVTVKRANPRGTGKSSIGFGAANGYRNSASAWNSMSGGSSWGNSQWTRGPAPNMWPQSNRAAPYSSKYSREPQTLSRMPTTHNEMGQPDLNFLADLPAPAFPGAAEDRQTAAIAKAAQDYYANYYAAMYQAMAMKR